MIGLFWVAVSFKFAYAEEIWSDNFDNYTQDYVCANNVGNCPRPSQYVYFYGDRSTSDAPDAAITSDAARTPGTNQRGFRLYVQPNSSGTCCENKLTRLGLDIGYNFYLRWYQRMNYNSQSSYKKIFRIKTTGGSQRFILDWYNSYSTGTNLILFTNADGFQQRHANTNYTLETDYTPNTWVCFEVFIDQTNDEWTLWVDGVQQGGPVKFTPSNYFIDGFSIGGNQVGTSGRLHLVDYDDIVVGTTYIGPVGAEPTQPSPAPTSPPSTPTNPKIIIN
jgi:hypothetical protein